MEYFTSMTGMHEFAEFAMADVGTGDSGLNSIVLANNNEMVGGVGGDSSTAVAMTDTDSPGRVAVVSRHRNKPNRRCTFGCCWKPRAGMLEA